MKLNNILGEPRTKVRLKDCLRFNVSTFRRIPKSPRDKDVNRNTFILKLQQHSTDFVNSFI